MSNILLSTAAQKVWDFLCRDPQRAFYGAEVAQETRLSKGGVSEILRAMTRQGLLRTEKKGRMVFYHVDARSPLVRQFKILRNVTLVEGLIQKIKPFCERVVLFGSCAQGEDTTESDMDIFIVSREKEQVRALVPREKDRRKVQLVVKTPQEFMVLEKKEPVFYGEVQRGIVLWEKE
jgi:predicted nucleotidyltransferase